MFIKFVGTLNKIRIIIYYSYIQADIENLGGVILPALFINKEYNTTMQLDDVMSTIIQLVEY